MRCESFVDNVHWVEEGDEPNRSAPAENRVTGQCGPTLQALSVGGLLCVTTVAILQRQASRHRCKSLARSDRSEHQRLAGRETAATPGWGGGDWARTHSVQEGLAPSCGNGVRRDPRESRQSIFGDSWRSFSSADSREEPSGFGPYPGHGGDTWSCRQCVPTPVPCHFWGPG